MCVQSRICGSPEGKGMVIFDENIGSGNLFKIRGKAEYSLNTGVLYTQDQSICQNMQQKMYSRIQLVSTNMLLNICILICYTYGILSNDFVF